MSDINKTLEQLKFEIEHLKQCDRHKAREINELSDKIRHKDKENELLIEKLRYQNAHTHNLEYENSKLKEDNSSLCERINKICMGLPQVRLDSKESARMIESLDNEITRLKSQWEGQCTLVDTLNEKLDYFTTCHGQNLEQIVLLEVKNNELTESNKNLLRRIEVVKERYKINSDSNEDYLIQELNNKIWNLTKSRDDLRKNNKALTAKIADLSKMLDEQTQKIIKSGYSLDEYTARFPN